MPRSAHKLNALKLWASLSSLSVQVVAARLVGHLIMSSRLTDTPQSRAPILCPELQQRHQRVKVPSASLRFVGLATSRASCKETAVNHAYQLEATLH